MKVHQWVNQGLMFTSELAEGNKAFQSASQEEKIALEH